MATVHHNLSQYDDSTLPAADDLQIGIVVSEWNAEVTHALYDGCYETLRKHGVAEDSIHTLQVPGSFELPVGAKLMAGSTKVDAVVCLGCVIKGETAHNEYISNAVATGLTNLSIASSIPFIFGLLTPDTLEQAHERAGGRHGNKGVEAAVTAIRMAHLRKTKAHGKKGIGFSR